LLSPCDPIVSLSTLLQLPLLLLLYHWRLSVDKAWEQRTARGAQVPRAAQSAWREGSNL